MSDALSDLKSARPERFLFGASVAPFAKSMDYPEEEWERDFQRMREINITAVRCYVSWDRVEQREGELDFHAYDHICELGRKYDIGIIMNLGGVFSCLTGVYPPQWLARKYHCQAPMDSPTAQACNDFPRISVCLDDKLYREKAFEFMCKTVRRYATDRAVIGWMSWNEPGMPFCYCPATQARFREWLQAKYAGDLSELNRVWGTEFPINYDTWDEVRAPAGFGFIGGGLNAWRDWHVFTQWRLSEAMEQIRTIVHENDTLQRPVTSNLVHNQGYFRGTMTNLNVDTCSGALDVVGLSYYTRAHQGDSYDPIHKGYCLSRYRSASREAQRRLWVLETEAGPNVRQITESQRKLNYWIGISNNVKCYLLWIYRCRYSDNQVGNFNLMAWNGDFTRRARYNGEFSRLLQRHGSLLNNVVKTREAAIFVPELQSILTVATHGSALLPNLSVAYQELEICAQSKKGAYKLLWDRNIPVDCITEWNLQEMNKYKLILLPMIENMTPEWAEAIRAYVEQGGMVIAESPFAYKDGDNFLKGKAPIFGLDKVFGAWTNDREASESAPLMLCPDGGTAHVCHFWHFWHLDGARTLVPYANNSPAVIEHSYGKGRAVLAGTEIFRQLFENEQPHLTSVLHDLVLGSGARRTARVTVDGVKDAVGVGIEVARLEGNEGIVFVVMNHNESVKKVELELSDEVKPLYDMMTEAEFDGQPFVLQPLGVKVLYCDSARMVSPKRCN